MLSDCGLNKGFMYGLEKRAKALRVIISLNFADYFNVSIDYLAGRSDKKSYDIRICPCEYIPTGKGRQQP